MASQNLRGLIDKYHTIIITLAFLSFGVVCLIFGYFTDPAHTNKPYPFVSFLLQQIGAIALFTGVYTSISDYFVRKNFEKQIGEAIDFVRLDQSIRDFGLSQVRPKFSWDDTKERIRQSSSVRMIVLRSNTFFEGNYEKLLDRLHDGSLLLTVVFPNPNNFALISLLARKFTNLSRPEQLAESIVSVINVWLKRQIYDLLPPERRAGLRVLLVDKYPLYSAYLFDQGEFWYVPYHYRNDHQDLPVFVFREEFDQSEIYRDFASLLAQATQHDLRADLLIPSFPAKEGTPNERAASL
jgi:hypothetical protein